MAKLTSQTCGDGVETHLYVCIGGGWGSKNEWIQQRGGGGL